MRKIYNTKNEVVGMTSTPQPKKPNKAELQARRDERIKAGKEYDKAKFGYGSIAHSLEAEAE